MITGKTEQDQKFISVYRAHVDEVYQFIYLRTGLNQTVAEDVTQDIFTEVYKKGFQGSGACPRRERGSFGLQETG